MFGTTLLDWLISLVIAHNTWNIWRARHEPVVALERGAARSKTQKRAIALSVILNLAVLGFFKYFNFGVDSFNALAQSLGLESWQWNTFFRVILPLGISFYTFQAMSYTIDVYRGEAKAMKNFTDFSCLFPSSAPGSGANFEVFVLGRPIGKPDAKLYEIRAWGDLRSVGIG